MNLVIRLSREEIRTALAELHQAIVAEARSRSNRKLMWIAETGVWIPIGIIWAYVAGAYGIGAAFWLVGSVAFMTLAPAGLRVVENRYLLNHLSEDRTA